MGTLTITIDDPEFTLLDRWGFWRSFRLSDYFGHHTNGRYVTIELHRGRTLTCTEAQFDTIQPRLVRLVNQLRDAQHTELEAYYADDRAAKLNHDDWRQE